MRAEAQKSKGARRRSEGGRLTENKMPASSVVVKYRTPEEQRAAEDE